MKTTPVLLIALLGTCGFFPVKADVLDRIPVSPIERSNAIYQAQQSQSGAQPSFSPQNVPVTPIAEQITGGIQQLAQNLESDPV